MGSPRFDGPVPAHSSHRPRSDPESDHGPSTAHRAASERGDRLRPVNADTTIAPGITLTLTPGHLSVLVSSQGRPALLLGDAIVCPVQIDEPTWHSIGDVDPQLAQRVRKRLFRELEDDTTLDAGAHFPELQFGRVLSGQTRRWLT